MEYLESTWEHLYLTFRFAGNGLAPTTNLYCDLYSAKDSGVMEQKYNFQCPG